MSTFIVTMYEAFAVEYKVEAESLEEAKETVEYGDSNISYVIRSTPIERECVSAQLG